MKTDLSPLYKRDGYSPQMRMAALLIETILVYTIDTINGANPHFGDASGRHFRCKYAPLEGKPQGCGIGRLLDIETAKELDLLGLDMANFRYEFAPDWDSLDGYDLDEDAPETVFLERAPKWMRGMDLIFLSYLQTLHDTLRHWNKDGLSSEGVDTVRWIVRTFGLKGAFDVILLYRSPDLSISFDGGTISPEDYAKLTKWFDLS